MARDIFLWVFFGAMIVLLFVVFKGKLKIQYDKFRKRKEAKKHRKQQEDELKIGLKLTLREKVVYWLIGKVDDAIQGIGQVLCGVGYCFVLAGIVILIYQCYLWLKTGTWTEFPVWKIFAYFDEHILDRIQTNWKGIQKIILWLLNLSSVLVLWLIGPVLFAIGLVMFAFIGFREIWLIKYFRRKHGTDTP